jgi:uncharacterized RDD family membrane protein YckC
MIDEQSVDAPVEDAPIERAVEPRRGTASPKAYFCPECRSQILAGDRICMFCDCYLPAPHVGRLASAPRRLGAEALDHVIRDGGIVGTLLWPAIMPSGVGATVVSIMSLLYGASTLFLWTRGTTPAKRLLRMTVITEDGEPAGFLRMAFRETVGKAISGVVFGLGFIAVARDAEKRGWHDRMAGTWVVFDDEL